MGGRPRLAPAWTGAVLTGGASSRMGRDKALLEVGGTALARTVAGALTVAGADRVVAVGGDRARLAALGLEVVADLHPGEGPLGGILTALDAADTDVVVVLACDLPGADGPAVAAVVDALVRAPAAAVAWPVVAGRHHVLHAAWRAGLAAPVLRAAFAAGERSPRRAADRLARASVTTVAERVVRNANRPGDLDEGWRRDRGATGQNGRMPDASPTPEVDVTVLAQAHAGGAYVLDVRQPDEYEAGHVPGAVLVPLDQLPGRLAEIPRDEHLYVICRSGGRSAAAVEALTGAGYTATNVAGGTLAWIDAGNPTVSGPDAGER